MSQSSQHERLLLKRFAESRDPGLREELVRCFIPLARSLALRYRGGVEPVEDLVQVASVGLIKALDRYDPGRETDFAAYAAPTILGELRHHFRDNSWSVRLPRGLQERTMRVAEAGRELRSESQRPASVSEVAERASLREGEVIEAMQAERSRRTMSLDAPVARPDGDLAPMVETIGFRDRGFERVEADLAAGSAALRPREREALQLRFHEGLTQREIGARIGVSQMQVSRLLHASLEKLLAAVQGGERSELDASPGSRLGAA